MYTELLILKTIFLELKKILNRSKNVYIFISFLSTMYEYLFIYITHVIMIYSGNILYLFPQTC